MYERAEPLVEELVRLSATPDMVWLLSSVYHALQRPAHLQLETLQHFITSAPLDNRTAQAWKQIGDLYGGDQLPDRQTPLAAYHLSDHLADQVPHLSPYLHRN